MEDLLVKLFSYLLLPIFALVLISCSQDLSDSSPVSPESQIAKVWNGEENDLAYPYSYMTALQKISVKQWNYDEGVIIADFVDYPSNAKHVFCVIDVKGTSHLYFIERPEKSEVTVVLPSKGTYTEVSDVRFYSYSESEVALKEFYKRSKYPYGYMEYFSPLNVLECNCVNDYDLNVYSDKLGELKQMFAEVKKDNGDNCIVFLQRPANENFVIPNVVDRHFSEVNLFGLY